MIECRPRIKNKNKSTEIIVPIAVISSFIFNMYLGIKILEPEALPLIPLTFLFGYYVFAIIVGIPSAFIYRKYLERETPEMKRQAVKQSVLAFVEFARKTK